VTYERDGSPVDLERRLVQVMAENRMTRRQLLERMGAVGIAAALAPIVAACSSAGLTSPSPSASAAAAIPSTNPTTAPSASAAASASPSAAASVAAASPPTPEKELIVYNWDSYIGENTVAQFEDKYGVKVKYVRFTDAVTQMASLRKDGKGGGYDVSYPASTEIPGLVRDGIIQPLHRDWIPNIVNLGAEWQNPSYDPNNQNSVPNYWWTTGFTWDPAKIPADLTSWNALWDPTYSGHIGMLDDVQECFAAASFKLGLPINSTNDAELDQALAALEQQKPLLRKYTDDDIGDMTSGQLWISHAWSGDWVQMTYDNPAIKYVIPSEGAIRGSDTMVVTSGAPHPIAANLWIDFNLDARISAANSNYTGYLGPNAAAMTTIDPSLLSNPNLNPSAEMYAKLTELIQLEGADLDKYTQRWNALRA
jgi:spermidine/putrescine transport system substrate-binding protein